MSTRRTKRERCECEDTADGHPVRTEERNENRARCLNLVSTLAEPLYRVDMDDESGTLFCEHCAEDAMESGVFTSRDDEEVD